MQELVRPRRMWLKIPMLLLHSYLIMSLAGCASKKAPSADEIRQLETRTVAADFTTAFDASVNLLQDLGFTIDMMNTEAGVITASKQSMGNLGDNFTDSELGDDDDFPTWALVLLIITGVIIVIGIIAIIAAATSGDDDDKDKKKDRKKTEDKDKKSRQKGESDDTRGEDKEREHDRDRHQEHDHDRGSTIIIADALLDSERADDLEYYNYRISINLTPLDEGQTKLRTSVQGSRMKGFIVRDTGPVYDVRFFRGFYTALDHSLTLESPAVEPVPEE